MLEEPKPQIGGTSYVLILRFKFRNITETFTVLRILLVYKLGTELTLESSLEKTLEKKSITKFRDTYTF